MAAICARSLKVMVSMMSRGQELGNRGAADDRRRAGRVIDPAVPGVERGQHGCVGGSDGSDTGFDHCA